MQENSLIETVIKKRQIEYYLVSEDDLNNLSNKQIIAEVSFLLGSVILAPAVSLTLSFGISGTSIILFVVAAALLTTSILVYIFKQKFIKKLKESGEVLSFEKSKQPKNKKGDVFGIVSAMYGTIMKDVDVTKQLNELIKDGVLEVVVSNKIAGDPHPGVLKTLRVEYYYNDFILTREYLEGDTVKIP